MVAQKSTCVCRFQRLWQLRSQAPVATVREKIDMRRQAVPAASCRFFRKVSQPISRHQFAMRTPTDVEPLAFIRVDPTPGQNSEWLLFLDRVAGAAIRPRHVDE